MNERYKTTILLTTHDITDIEALCERVIMLDEGNIMYDGSYIIFVRSGEQRRKYIFSLSHQFPIRLYQWLCQIVMSFGRKRKRKTRGLPKYRMKKLLFQCLFLKWYKPSN